MDPEKEIHLVGERLQWNRQDGWVIEQTYLSDDRAFSRRMSDRWLSQMAERMKDKLRQEGFDEKDFEQMAVTLDEARLVAASVREKTKTVVSEESNK